MACQNCATLKAEVASLTAELDKYKSLGRPSGRATTPDARLVARVCTALGLSRTALLVRLGYAKTSGALSRCNGPRAVPLTEQAREQLRALLEEAREGK